MHRKHSTNYLGHNTKAMWIFLIKLLLEPEGISWHQYEDELHQSYIMLIMMITQQQRQQQEAKYHHNQSSSSKAYSHAIFYIMSYQLLLQLSFSNDSFSLIYNIYLQ
jgi:hypothetical protein